MESEIQLNDHNKQEYPPNIQMRHIILFFRQKNIRTKKKHGNRKFDKSYYPVCL